MKNDANNRKRKRSLVTEAGIFLGRLRIAFRGLWKKPLITVSAIISIALGIGASTAMFSIYDEFLMRRLPVPEPERLVNFSAPGPKPGGQTSNLSGGADDVFSYPMFRDLEQVQTVFTGIAAHRLFDASIATSFGSSHESGLFVSGNYFPVLGIQPALGRLLHTNDDKIIGDGQVGVLSYDYWQKNFGGDAGILNQDITINGQSMTIAGVTPQGFTGTTLGSSPRIFVPITMRARLQPGLPTLDSRMNYWAYVFGRLKPGVTLEQASAVMNVPYHNITNQVEAPEAERLIGQYDSVMDMFRARQLVLKPGARGQSNYSGMAKSPLNIFMGCTLLVLLIACANVTGILLARGIARSGEMALRSALGASRMQIFTQLLTESFILVFIAGIAGILAGHWMLRAIVTMIPAQFADNLSFTLNGTALLFAVALTFAAGIVVGLFPAAYGARADLTSLMKDQTAQVTGSKSAIRFRTGLSIAQIALSLALIVVSGLFSKSLYNSNRIDTGMKIDRVVTFSVSPILKGYTPPQSTQYFERLENELAAIPGVESVTGSSTRLLSGAYNGSRVIVEGYNPANLLANSSAYNRGGTDYFKTLGIPLIAGRDFSREDMSSSSKVAVVNEAFAEKFNLGRDAVGKRIGFDADVLDVEIVGLVKNSSFQSFRDSHPLVIVPFQQSDTNWTRTFYVNTALPLEQLFPQIRRVAAQLDSTLPVENLSTMARQVHDQTFDVRLMVVLSNAFAFMATLLTAVGLYGIFSYNVARRRREIGLRMAFGATRVSICLMFLRQSSLIALAGCVPGFALGVFAGRVIQSLLYGLEGFDTGVFLGAAALLFIIITLVVLIPVCRTVLNEPLELLREE